MYFTLQSQLYAACADGGRQVAGVGAAGLYRVADAKELKHLLGMRVSVHGAGGEQSKLQVKQVYGDGSVCKVVGDAGWWVAGCLVGQYEWPSEGAGGLSAVDGAPIVLIRAVDVVDVDPSEGLFYATAKYEGRTAFLAGPFDHHLLALRGLSRVKVLAQERLTGREVFEASFGTCRLNVGVHEAPQGVFNDQLKGLNAGQFERERMRG